LAYVSIIVPNYNHALFLNERLDSIFRQTYDDYEVIILDDCSNDNSIDVIGKYISHPKVSNVVINRVNGRSTYLQWIKGIELAKGEYIWIAESDDYCDKDFLTNVMNVLADKSIALCFTHSFIVDENNNNRGLYFYPWSLFSDNFITNGNELIKDYFCSTNIIPNASAVVFKKGLVNDSIKREVGKFKINGDWFVWINLLMNGKCGFISYPHNNFRRHSGASSSHNVSNFKNIEEALIINHFLKKNRYKIDIYYWLNAWLIQANFKLKIILSHNFFNIYLQAIKLYPFPILFIFYKVLMHKLKKT
jgi:glycosyltransferase involved in cell wall biosynthesis